MRAGLELARRGYLLDVVAVEAPVCGRRNLSGSPLDTLHADRASDGMA